MKIKDIKELFKARILELFILILNICSAIGIVLIVELHMFVPFYPILVLFDYCFVFGYPLFLHYVIKKQWFKCIKQNDLLIKYILLPWLIMELLVLLYYHNETKLIIDAIMESNGWK